MNLLFNYQPPFHKCTEPISARTSSKMGFGILCGSYCSAITDQMGILHKFSLLLKDV